MIEITEDIRNAILAHARLEYPRESCGLLVMINGTIQYRETINSADGHGEFCIEPEEYAKLEDAGEVISIVHSHPTRNCQPSQADLVGCEKSGLTWVICNPITAEVNQIKPNGYRAPLEGREWSYGVLDCYALVRDYYAERLQIELPDFHRPGEWWLNGGNLFMEKFAETGFVQMRDPAEHDVIMMQFRAEVPNHLAVMLSGHQIMQHVRDHLSHVCVWGGYWEQNTTGFFRHRSLC
jgi:proteasome lid subunit RPN8/RPN11